MLPLLSDVAGRDLVPVLARQAELLADDADLLEALSAGHRPDRRPPARRGAPVPWPAGPSAAGCGAAPALPTPSTIRRRPAEVARVLAVARGDGRACELAGGRRVERHGGRLRVTGR